MSRNTKNFLKMACLVAAAYAVGNVKGHKDCLGKVYDKYHEYIPDDTMSVKIGNRATLSVHGVREADEKVTENAD